MQFDYVENDDIGIIRLHDEKNGDLRIINWRPDRGFQFVITYQGVQIGLSSADGLNGHIHYPRKTSDGQMIITIGEIGYLVYRGGFGPPRATPYLFKNRTEQEEFISFARKFFSVMDLQPDRMKSGTSRASLQFSQFLQEKLDDGELLQMGAQLNDEAYLQKHKSDKIERYSDDQQRMNYVHMIKDYKTCIRSLDDSNAELLNIGHNREGGFDFVLYWNGKAIGLTTREGGTYYSPELLSDGTYLITLADIGFEVPNSMGRPPYAYKYRFKTAEEQAAALDLIKRFFTVASYSPREVIENVAKTSVTFSESLQKRIDRGELIK